MNPIDSTVTMLFLGLLVSLGATAQESISRGEFKASKERIEANYKTAKATCDSLAGNQKDICVAEAKGEKKVSEAELDARYKPGAKAEYNIEAAKAEAAYEVAKERCDDQSGNAKDVCVKKAKAEETAAKADAKAGMKGHPAPGSHSDATDVKPEVSARIIRVIR